MKTTVDIFKELLEDVKRKNYDLEFARNYILGAYDMAKTIAILKGESTAELILLTHDFLFNN